jgi:hypothetical protein
MLMALRFWFWLFSKFVNMVKDKRNFNENWKTITATRKAISLIESWWRRGRVRIIFKRQPELRLILRRAILPFHFRLKLRGKRQAATLMTTFLQDCTGMSATMRAIYAFRQTVIRLQRWIRGWIEVQRCRMRILWMKSERMVREHQREERALKLREEKERELEFRKLHGATGGGAGGAGAGAGEPVATGLSAHASHAIAQHHALSQQQMAQMGETVEEIAHKRRLLARLLDEQDDARLARFEEAKFKEEQQLRKEQAKQAGRQNQHRSASSKHRTAAGAAAGDLSPRIAAQAVVVALPKYLMKKSAARKAAVPWHIKIRTSASNIKTYETLRDILKYERRRHAMNLIKRSKMTDVCLVGTHELRRYLRNPHSHEGANEISLKLVVQKTVERSPAE